MPLSYFTRRASETPMPEQQSTPTQHQPAQQDTAAAHDTNAMAPPQTPAAPMVDTSQTPAQPVLAPPQMPMQALQQNTQSFSWAASGHVKRDGQPDKSTCTTSTMPIDMTLKNLGRDIIIMYKKNGKIPYRAGAEFLLSTDKEVFSLHRLLDDLHRANVRTGSENIFLSGYYGEDDPIMTDIQFSTVLQAIWAANPDKPITTWLTLDPPHHKRDREREEGEVSDDSRGRKRAKCEQPRAGERGRERGRERSRRGELTPRSHAPVRGAGRGGRGRGRGGIAIGSGDCDVSRRFGAREHGLDDHYG